MGQPPKYRPSNGVEGAWFHNEFCSLCRSNTEDGCEIETMAMFHSIDEEGYPTQWVYGAGGEPTCTAFEDSQHDDGV